MQRDDDAVSVPTAPMQTAPMPTVTVYAYSQTGQLHEALTALLTPLEKAGARVNRVAVTPQTAYPFPWPVRRFFGIFPDAVDPDAVVGVRLDPAQPPDADLVVLGFQVWYLAPSIPVRSLLASRPFAGQEVLGVVACRNMWYSAALDVQRRVAAAGSRYLGTVAAIDTAPAAVTFVTTLAWLLRGRRAPIWRLPPAGISASEITRLGELGEELAARLSAPSQEPAAQRIRAVLRDRIALRDREAAAIDVPMAVGDLIAGRAFGFWGRAVRSRARRAERFALLVAFVATLSGAILLGLPILVAASVLGRSRLEAAVRSRLAPALALGDAGSGRR